MRSLDLTCPRCCAVKGEFCREAIKLHGEWITMETAESHRERTPPLDMDDVRNHLVLKETFNPFTDDRYTPKEMPTV